MCNLSFGSTKIKIAENVLMVPLKNVFQGCMGFKFGLVQRLTCYLVPKNYMIPVEQSSSIKNRVIRIKSLLLETVTNT